MSISDSNSEIRYSITTNYQNRIKKASSVTQSRARAQINISDYHYEQNLITDGTTSEGYIPLI